MFLVQWPQVGTIFSLPLVDEVVMCVVSITAKEAPDAQGGR